MRKNVTLWVVQGLLAALFLLAGGMKVVLLIEAMAGPVALPGLLRIHAELTPVAAAGLTIIMIGATVITAMGGTIAPAVVPFIVGVLAASVAYGRARSARLTLA
jgi:hypothetical protein